MGVQLTNIKQDERFKSPSIGAVLLSIFLGIICLSYFDNILLKLGGIVISVLFSFVFGQVPLRNSITHWKRWLRGRVLSTNHPTKKFKMQITDIPNIADRLHESVWSTVEISQSDVDKYNDLMAKLESEDVEEDLPEELNTENEVA